MYAKISLLKPEASSIPIKTGQWESQVLWKSKKMRLFPICVTTTLEGNKITQS